LLHTAHYSLYVDDVNKKWVVALASAKYDYMDKIRGFNELVDFVFFDEEADNWLTNLGKYAGQATNAMRGPARGGGAVLGLLLGAGLGASLVAGSGGNRVGLGALVGGILGGVGASKLAQVKQSQPETSISGAYGLIIHTTDADVNNPVTVYDFVEIDGKTMRSAPSVGRAGRVYKKDIKIIAEMLGVLEYIKGSVA